MRIGTPEVPFAIHPLTHGKLAELVFASARAYLVCMNDVARTLFLVCYDIGSPKRLHRVHKYLLGYRVGGRFYEVLISKGLRQRPHFPKCPCPSTRIRMVATPFHFRWNRGPQSVSTRSKKDARKPLFTRLLAPFNVDVDMA